MTLDEAPEAFGKSRSSALTPIIDELGRAALRGFTAPAPKRNFEFHRAWLELARDASRRSWCLETILEKLPKLIEGEEHQSGDKVDAVLERLEALCSVPPDPRIARAMLELFELRSPNTGYTLGNVLIARALVRHGDDTTAASPLIEELAREKEVAAIFARKRLPKAIGAPKHEGGAPASRAKLDVKALYAAVYADPASDAPREVLADALQERGEPRGEFIALQLQEHRATIDDETRARAQELVEAHGKSWLGALRPIVYRAELRRGFLSRLELAGSWNSDRWEALSREPMLATVETLASGQATGETYATMLAGVAKTVRSIEAFDDRTWKAIAANSWPQLDELVVEDWKRKDYGAVLGAQVIPWLLEHPQVTRLTVKPEALAKLPAALFARLTELRIVGPLPDLAARWAEWKHLRTLTTGFNALSLVRVDGAEVARLVADRSGFELKLDGLPATIERVEVFNNAKAARELAQRLGAQRVVEAMPTPSGKITGVK